MIAMQVSTLYSAFIHVPFELIYSSQGLTIYFAVLHGLHIQRERNNAIELATTDDVVISRYNRKNDF